jgi:hypothetical protein
MAPLRLPAGLTSSHLLQFPCSLSYLSLKVRLEHWQPQFTKLEAAFSSVCGPPGSFEPWTRTKRRRGMMLRKIIINLLKITECHDCLLVSAFVAFKLGFPFSCSRRSVMRRYKVLTLTGFRIFIIYQ